MITIIAILDFHGAKNLAEGLLNVACADHSNDPFEWHFAFFREISDESCEIHTLKLRESCAKIGHPFATEDIRVSRRRIRENSLAASLQTRIDTHRKLRDDFRILCCGKARPEPDIYRKQQIFMWGYYAAEYRGIRIHFHDAFFNLPIWEVQYPVKYFPSPQIHSPDSQFDENSYGDFWEKLLTSKSDAWEIENEYRMIVNMKDVTLVRNDGDGIERSYIGVDSTAIARIDLGMKFFEHRHNEDQECVDQIVERLPETEIWMTRKSDSDYAIE